MISWVEILIRLSLAALFGASIGLERERKDWAAGMRTHMLVCVGSALIMIVSAFGFTDILGTQNVILDPSRMAAQVISGIGFIGAGTILFLKQGTIRGLTTAAGLWTVAAIGLATGGGMYFAALITTILAIFILWLLQPIERRFSERFKQKSLQVIVSDKTKSAKIVAQVFNTNGVEVSDCIIDNSDNEYIISFKFKNVSTQELANTISAIQSDVDIKGVTWNN